MLTLLVSFHKVPVKNCFLQSLSSHTIVCYYGINFAWGPFWRVLDPSKVDWKTWHPKFGGSKTLLSVVQSIWFLQIWVLTRLDFLSLRGQVPCMCLKTLPDPFNISILSSCSNLRSRLSQSPHMLFDIIFPITCIVTVGTIIEGDLLVVSHGL